jgi:hypothetical protein
MSNITEENALIYAEEKVGNTLLFVATGSGSLQDRLAEAAMNDFISVFFDDLPESLRSPAMEILNQLTAQQTSNVGEALRGMDAATAKGIVDRLISLYRNIVEYRTAKKK